MSLVLSVTFQTQESLSCAHWQQCASRTRIGSTRTEIGIAELDDAVVWGVLESVIWGGFLWLHFRPHSPTRSTLFWSTKQRKFHWYIRIVRSTKHEGGGGTNFATKKWEKQVRWCRFVLMGCGRQPNNGVSRIMVLRASCIVLWIPPWTMSVSKQRYCWRALYATNPNVSLIQRALRMNINRWGEKRWNNHTYTIGQRD